MEEQSVSLAFQKAAVTFMGVGTASQTYSWPKWRAMGTRKGAEPLLTILQPADLSTSTGPWPQGGRGEAAEGGPGTCYLIPQTGQDPTLPFSVLDQISLFCLSPSRAPPWISVVEADSSAG